MHCPKEWLLSFSRNEIKLMLKFVNGYSPRAKKQQSCYKWLQSLCIARVWRVCMRAVCHHPKKHMSTPPPWPLCKDPTPCSGLVSCSNNQCRPFPSELERAKQREAGGKASHVNKILGKSWLMLKPVRTPLVIFLLPWNVSVKPMMISQWRKWILSFAYIPVLTDLRCCVLWDHY